MTKYHYSEKVGDFTICKAAEDCPLGDTKHLEVDDNITIGEFNKKKEEFFEEQYNGSFGNTMSKKLSKSNKNNKTINKAELPTQHSDFDPHAVNIDEFRIAIDEGTHISELVKEGSVIVFKSKPYEVKDYSFDKFSGNITIETADGSEITVNERGANSLRFSANDMIKNGLDPFKYDYSNSEYRPVTDLRVGDMYSTSYAFYDDNGRIVTEIEENHPADQTVIVHSVDRYGNMFRDEITETDTVPVATGGSFDNPVNDDMYMSETFKPAPVIIEAKDRDKYDLGYAPGSDLTKYISENDVFTYDNEPKRVASIDALNQYSGNSHYIIHTTDGDSIEIDDINYDKVKFNRDSVLKDKGFPYDADDMTKVGSVEELEIGQPFGDYPGDIKVIKDMKLGTDQAGKSIMDVTYTEPDGYEASTIFYADKYGVFNAPVYLLDRWA